MLLAWAPALILLAPQPSNLSSGESNYHPPAHPLQRGEQRQRHGLPCCPHLPPRLWPMFPADSALSSSKMIFYLFYYFSALFVWSSVNIGRRGKCGKTCSLSSGSLHDTLTLLNNTRQHSLLVSLHPFLCSPMSCCLNWCSVMHFFALSHSCFWVCLPHCTVVSFGVELCQFASVPAARIQVSGRWLVLNKQVLSGTGLASVSDAVRHIPPAYRSLISLMSGAPSLEQEPLTCIRPTRDCTSVGEASK